MNTTTTTLYTIHATPTKEWLAAALPLTSGNYGVMPAAADMLATYLIMNGVQRDRTKATTTNITVEVSTDDEARLIDLMDARLGDNWSSYTVFRMEPTDYGYEGVRIS